MPEKNEIKLERLTAVSARTGRGKSTIWRDIASGTFPQPIKIGARACAWLSTEIDQWIIDRVADSRD